MGGENFQVMRICPRSFGSSPRGRGKPSAYTRTRTSYRLIPAWAGKTGRRMSLDMAVPAHPRVGGENAMAKGEITAQEGSSPRGRGKPQAGGGQRFGHGLIPAWAGKTPDQAERNHDLAAHPRVGGENGGFSY